MARSPSVTSPTLQKVSAGKAKAHTILTGAANSSISNVNDEDEAPLDLAEHLNEQTRKKYYRNEKPLGEGTYAFVYAGHVVKDASTRVAIKKIKKSREEEVGMPPDPLREIKALQELRHPNIITLYDVFSTKDQNLNLVLEFLPLGDMEELIKNRHKGTDIKYTVADMKAWMGMLCRGVWFCHENGVLHRDLKPNNLLIAADGELKIADFGLSRTFADPSQEMTSFVITRWYRPLELLYGAQHYSGAVDVWSIGTIFAEIVKRVPFLPGSSDVHQAELICDVIGTPSESNWPGVTKLRNYMPTPAEKVRPVKGKDFYMRGFGVIGEEGVDLLMSMLKLDPRSRPSCRTVLKHKWWLSMPKPTSKEKLPRKGGGIQKTAENLKRKPGDLESNKLSGVARKLQFTAKG
ncbi:MAG: hypothetical protein Q9162_000697 [Coniocarpon cinnabarinum]